MEEVDICIPAFNEENIIIPTIDALLALCDSYPNYSWRISVIDNGSSDNTAALVNSHSDKRVRLLQQSISGKGAALMYGALKTTSDILVYIDADLSADPKHILDLLEKIRSGADVAVGSRLMNTHIVHRSFWRTLTAHIFRIYAEILVPVPVTDSQCGLKMMNKKGIEILASCEDRSWFIDREFLAKSAKRKLSIVELPVTWEEFRYPNRKSKLHVLQAGLKSLYSLWRIRKSVKKFA